MANEDPINLRDALIALLRDVGVGHYEIGTLSGTRNSFGNMLKSKKARPTLYDRTLEKILLAAAVAAKDKGMNLKELAHNHPILKKLSDFDKMGNGAAGLLPGATNEMMENHLIHRLLKQGIADQNDVNKAILAALERLSSQLDRLIEPPEVPPSVPVKPLRRKAN